LHRLALENRIDFSLGDHSIRQRTATMSKSTSGPVPGIDGCPSKGFFPYDLAGSTTSHVLRPTALALITPYIDLCMRHKNRHRHVLGAISQDAKLLMPRGDCMTYLSAGTFCDFFQDGTVQVCVCRQNDGLSGSPLIALLT